ncbi:MAG: hypothetical protein IJQ14_06505 [Bacteroidales bacterium]|nr:hypothetical protein [Bacteroidales bacterium]
MSNLKAFAIIVSLLVGTTVLHAQNDVEVALIEQDGKVAYFAVDASAAKSDEVATVAFATLFRTLLDKGVEGFNGGRKLMDVNNAKWREDFLKGKNPKYMTYIKGYQTEGEPMKNTVGEYRATVLVRVNVEFLIRQLKAYGVLKG